MKYKTLFLPQSTFYCHDKKLQNILKNLKERFTELYMIMKGVHQGKGTGQISI